MMAKKVLPRALFEVPLVVPRVVSGVLRTVQCAESECLATTGSSGAEVGVRRWLVDVAKLIVSVIDLAGLEIRCCITLLLLCTMLVMSLVFLRIRHLTLLVSCPSGLSVGRG